MNFLNEYRIVLYNVSSLNYFCKMYLKGIYCLIILLYLLNPHLGTVVEARHCPRTGPYLSADTLSADRYELSADSSYSPLKYVLASS